MEYCNISILLEREQFYLDHLKPKYNKAKITSSTLGVPKSKETKATKINSLKGVYAGENSPLLGKTHTEETKLLMSKAHQGTNNSMYGKTHTEQTKLLMSLAKKGSNQDKKTKEAISAANGTVVYLYALESSTVKFCLIEKFTSLRKLGEFLGTSHSNVSRYLKSGAILTRNGISYKISLTELDT